MKTLLTREEFFRQVFARDQGKCIVCQKMAVDAHHLIDRSLFEDGGYHIDNGVALCSDHHLQAEQTILSCKALRKLAGITNVVLPEHLDTDEEWDHWANIVMPTGARLRGELFFQENVQKALKDGGVLGDFLPYVKYPRTFHLPWSPNLQNNDRQHKNVDALFQLPLIASIKADGENTTFYSDYIHARSIDSVHHESRSMVKALHGRIAHEIPEGWRICGENLFAKHSIHYHHLKDFFYVYSIWDENNVALSWHDTVEYCEMLGLHTVPVFHMGITCQLLVQQEFEKYCTTSPDEVEGYVLRFSGKIPYHLFKTRTAKFVRANHVQTDEFWMTQPVVPNKIEEGPIYNTDEIRELTRILLSSDSTFEKTAIDTQFIISNLSYVSNDSIRLKYELLDLIKKSDTTLDSYRGPDFHWSDINEERRLEALQAIYRAIFCDFKEVPLNINKPLKSVTKWRLEHGK